jgi:HAD superfamily hydrolase (TIGR01450 family)
VTDLLSGYDAALFDLDGTLFRGATALPGAVEAVNEVARRGVTVGYLTNNGSRSAEQVVEHLGELGFSAKPAEVVTSGQVAARILAGRVPAGTPVCVVGSDALAREVSDVGLRAVSTAEPGAAVIQGHSPETGWRTLAEACLAIRAGGVWVACNVDATLPDERGLLPGNGAMVAALRHATDQEPLVAGKPEPALFEEAVRRSGSTAPLVVGDRLNTDIAGAHRVGIPSLLVLTGVSDARELLDAAESERPTYVGWDLAALWEDAESARLVRRPGWEARVSGNELVLGSVPAAIDGREPDVIDALRTLCHVGWEHGGPHLNVRPSDELAERAVRELKLTAAAHDRSST